MTGISSHKNFQSDVNRLIVLRSVITSRFNNKTAFARKRLSNLNDRPPKKEPQLEEVPQDTPATRIEPIEITLFATPPIACPTPLEIEEGLEVEEKIEAEPIKKSLFAKIFNLDPAK